MSADRVAVLLPAFQRDVKDVAAMFSACSTRKHENYCFDLHYYYCFGWYHKLTVGQQLQRVKARQDDISKLPVCIGEWSLAMGTRASNSRSMPWKETRALFARAQRSVYDHASHGWFFWNWKDSAGPEWDYRLATRCDEGTFVGGFLNPAPVADEAANHGELAPAAVKPQVRKSARKPKAKKSTPSITMRLATALVLKLGANRACAVLGGRRARPTGPESAQKRRRLCTGFQGQVAPCCALVDGFAPLAPRSKRIRCTEASA